MMQDVNETTFETLQRDHIENNASWWQVYPVSSSIVGSVIGLDTTKASMKTHNKWWRTSLTYGFCNLRVTGFEY
jgi:phosphate/sulfate permease